ncbi:MAG: ATPase domain-containing protein [Actinomycetota bacterium]
MNLISTGIVELDEILEGGFSPGALVVIAGAPGTGKTILAQQFSFACATREHKAVYYSTLSEPHAKLIRHLESFEFFDQSALGGRVEFVHVDVASSHGNGRLEEAFGEIVRNCFAVQPTAVVIDSAKALHDSVGESSLREKIYELASRVAHTNAVLMFVGEYTEEELGTAPEFAVADTILYLANSPKGARDQRSLRVVKNRGSGYISGRHVFRIGVRGIEVFPRFESVAPVQREFAPGRVTSGSPVLDAMIGGGFPVGGSSLLGGPSGAGKTVLGLQFVVSGVDAGQRCLYVTFQESDRQLIAKAKAFGWDLEPMIEQGRLRVLFMEPVALGLDVVGAQLREILDREDFSKVVLDSLAEVEGAAEGTDRFPDFLWSLVNTFRGRGITSLFTNETRAFFGSSFELAGGLSYIFDNVILLRYVELDSEIRRAMAIVKMRDSEHVKSLVEFEVGGKGLVIRGKFTGLRGVLSGSPVMAEEKFREFFGS